VSPSIRFFAKITHLDDRFGERSTGEGGRQARGWVRGLGRAGSLIVVP